MGLSLGWWPAIIDVSNLGVKLEDQRGTSRQAYSGLQPFQPLLEAAGHASLTFCRLSLVHAGFEGSDARLQLDRLNRPAPSLQEGGDGCSLLWR